MNLLTRRVMRYDPMQFFAPLHHFTLCKTPVTGGLLPVTEASKGRISISTFSFVILEERHIFVPSLRGLLIV